MSMTSAAQKTQTVTETGIDQGQSQKLIHTMLGMSFGCVAFLRGLFPDDTFIDQRFIPRKFEKDYDPSDSSMKSDALKIKTLTRGKSPQVDMFLNWLDYGVVDALRKGYLKSLILAIFLDDNRPEELHEVYTFSFDYCGNKIKLEMNHGGTESVTLLGARQTLQHIMRRLIIVTQGLSPLPDKKFVSMRMLFTESCPKSYQPSGFKDASETPTAVIKTKKPRVESFAPGSLRTGCHEYDSTSEFIHVKVLTSIIEAPAQESDDDEEMIDIDPFAFSTKPSQNPPQHPREKPLTARIPTQEVSQTTKVLRDYLKDDKPNSFNLTQAIKRISCECGSSSELHYSGLTHCATCKATVHSVCYGLQGTPTVPYCYSCRSKTLGGIDIHEALVNLMNLRKLSVIFKTTIPRSMSETHNLLGYESGLHEKETCNVISLAFKLGLACLKVGQPIRSNIRPLKVDFRGLEVKGEELVEGKQYGWIVIPQLSANCKGELKKMRTNLSSLEKLLFVSSKGKSLIIDEGLDVFKVDYAGTLTDPEDRINSSDAEGPTNVEVQLDKLKIQEDIPSSNGFAFAKKRTRSTSQESIVDVGTIPIITAPRRKLRKTSAAILTSSIAQ